MNASHFQERQEKFRFIKHHKFKFSVEKMCKVLKVSTSGHYNWLKAKGSKLWVYNQKLSELITVIFKDSHESYGAQRIKMALEKLGYYVSRPRVARFMKAYAGLFLVSVSTDKGIVTRKFIKK